MKSSCKKNKVLRRAPICDPDSVPRLLCTGLRPVTIEHENPWFRVLSRGGYYTHESQRPQVAILPMVDNKSVVMLRVKRPVIGDCPLELPAGDSMHGESLRDAAAREFAEETGIEIKDKLRFKPELAMSEMPGRIPVLLSIFTIQLKKKEFDMRKKHDDEVYSVELIHIRDVAKKIISGEIYLSCPCAILSRLILKRVITTNKTFEV
jgi:8-oxo-dGTP pyrophosphatase MutT (NUDIX family)